MSHQAPAVGGASTSAAASALPPAHSAWNPYSILPPTTRRKVSLRAFSWHACTASECVWRAFEHGRKKQTLTLLSGAQIDPRETILSKSYLQELAIPGDVAAERIANKYLQLDPPEGKMSDRRKDELARRAVEKEKKRIKKVRDGECGLVGRRKRLTVSKEAQHRVRCVARACARCVAQWLTMTSAQLRRCRTSAPAVARIHGRALATANRRPSPIAFASIAD